MKNILVVLVTIGIGYAYWYQLPEAPVARPAPPAAATPKAVVVQAPAGRPAFVAAHTALDEPATRVGNQPKPSAALLLGNDNAGQTH